MQQPYSQQPYQSYSNQPPQPAFSQQSYGQPAFLQQQPYTQPPQPPYQPPLPPTPPTPEKSNWLKKPVRMPVWLFIIVLLLALAIGDGIGHTDTNGTNQTSTTGASAAATTQSGSTPAAANPTPQPPTPTPKPKTWQTTHSFQGNGSNKTSTFTIAGSDWKIDWTCDPTSFDGIAYNVAVDVDQPGNQLPVDPAVINTLCKSGNASGETEEYQSGTFYLDINSEAAWTIKVKELQ